MNTKYRFLTIVFVLMLTTLACGQLDIGIEEPIQPVEENEAQVIETPAPELEPQTDNTAARDDSEKEDFSQYWVEAEDPRTGLRFAIPCFWVVDIPPQQNNFAGLGSFSVMNFSQDFVASLGDKRQQMVWEIGGLKFDLGYHTMNEFNLSLNSTIEELAYALVNPDQEHGIDSTEKIEVNGKQALRVNTWSTFGDGGFYLLPFVNDMYILFAPYPDANHPDIQSILHSMALDPSAQVTLPTHQPANPPEGMAASCMGELVSGDSSSESAPLTGTLDCAQVTETDPIMWTICNVEASFISRNTQPLLGIMREPFKLGYWQSEGVDLTKEQAINEFQNSLIPPDPGALTFTMDETLFPPLFGMQPEQIFPPDANIVEVVYSEGWGPSGQGAALLYFADNGNGGIYFYGMVIAGAHFDK